MNLADKYTPGRGLILLEETGEAVMCVTVVGQITTCLFPPSVKKVIKLLWSQSAPNRCTGVAWAGP